MRLLMLLGTIGAATASVVNYADGRLVWAGVFAFLTGFNGYNFFRTAQARQVGDE